MGEYINKKIVIDKDTGEMLRESNWVGYDGFNEKGYKYRSRNNHIRLFCDTVPVGLSYDGFGLLMQLAEIANEENALVKRVERKSKFSNKIYKPLDKEEIRQRIKYKNKFGMNKFDRCWRELQKRCMKQVRYYDYMTWVLNPSIVYKSTYVPFWLCEEFKEDMQPYMSAMAVNKLNEKIKELYY